MTWGHLGPMLTLANHLHRKRVWNLCDVLFAVLEKLGPAIHMAIF